MNFLEIKDEHVTRFPRSDNTPERVHVFDTACILAVNAALAAKRPLLVRGEPGVGKSQLAAAVAKELERAFISFVVDARTESRDLLWQLDAVMRLGEAQVIGTRTFATAAERMEALKDLDISRFLRPGPLWWAFDWDSAQTQAARLMIPMRSPEESANAANGCVILIDEIDKGESDVPNGLLEALGQSEFTPLGSLSAVTVTQATPLVIITTNEERALPDAFLRRCFVLHLELPEAEEELTNFLMKRGREHFEKVHQDVLRKAASLLYQYRTKAISEHTRPLPGQAEYLDLIRAVTEKEKTKKGQLELLIRIAELAYQKHARLKG